jgi:hypothetical protein
LPIDSDFANWAQQLSAHLYNDKQINNSVTGSDDINAYWAGIDWNAFESSVTYINGRDSTPDMSNTQI